MVAVGAALPMDLGSAGKVLSDDPECPPIAAGPRASPNGRRGVASVSAPVVVDGRIVGAVSVSGPIGRTTRQPGRLYAAHVVEAAHEVERALGS